MDVKKMKLELMEDGIRMFLEGLCVDQTTEHLKRTPQRVATAWFETFATGYTQDVKEILDIQFTNKGEYDQMIIVKDIPFCSMCTHHLLPFSGKAKIGYIPKGMITGLSKLARALEVFARRLQIQEQLTQEVAQALNTHLKPDGVGVVIEAEHTCMTQRGVAKPGSITITSCLLGTMRDDPKTRAEFLAF